MLIPKFITAEEAAKRDLQEGWWATTEGGDTISGPYPTEEGPSSPSASAALTSLPDGPAKRAAAAMTRSREAC